MVKQIYLDCDVVLADFETGFENAIGCSPESFEQLYGSSKFWATVASTPNFFANLPLMPDAVALYESVKHYNPIILTGVPRGGWAAPQKLAWRDKHFPGVEMTCCSAKEKYKYCKPGDILIDDLEKYRHLWQSAGGHFILHKNAKQSITELYSVYI